MLYFSFSENKFLGALGAETIFPSSIRRRFVMFSYFGMLCALVPLGYAGITGFFKEVVILPAIAVPPQIFLGVFLLFFVPRLIVLAIESFINAKTFDKKGALADENLARCFNFYAARFWYEAVVVGGAATLAELLVALPYTSLGKILLGRLGITDNVYRTMRETARSAPEETTPLEELYTRLRGNKAGEVDIAFADVVQALFDVSSVFQNFCSVNGLRRDTLGGATEWVERSLAIADMKRRWWTRDGLGRIQGIGKGWAYGKATYLSKYAVELAPEALQRKEELVGREREIELLESALRKASGANALIVGGAGAGKHTVLAGFVRMIAEGKVFPDLEHKRVWQLYGEAVVAAGKNKGVVEEILFLIFNEAVGSGNIILVIDDFPEFVTSLSALGVSAGELFAPYLARPVIHLIALAEPTSFRRVLEDNTGLMHFFEKIEVSEPDEKRLVEILEDFAPQMERAVGYRTRFTYLALEKIAQGAIQYLVAGALPKRAIDLMNEVVDEAARKNMSSIVPELVLALIERKTKIPLGKVTDAEREKLLKLEDFLHQRVVDQEIAIRVIADAVRRARTEIRNPKRPIGTFLFLGPTGVGKTETAKALAEVYFGNEDTMARFDMTEYQTEDSVARLIGSFERNEAGLLTSRMRSSPYSLVLLDEFEKASREVKNLFLQILDEGFFSDYLGQRINMRNTIVIATSNAGSSLIWELVQQGADLSQIEKDIIAYVQKEKILSPELLNRFDAVVVFRPLQREALTIIARFMLQKLVLRLKEQNMQLAVTDELIAAVAEGGYSPEFGARPMQRFIQDRVEKIIAEKIIKGEIKPGSEFTLSPAEFSSRAV